jgi:hypothetical protein
MTNRPPRNPLATRAPHCVALAAAGQSLRRRRPRTRLVLFTQYPRRAAPRPLQNAASGWQQPHHRAAYRSRWLHTDAVRLHVASPSTEQLPAPRAMSPQGPFPPRICSRASPCTRGTRVITIALRVSSHRVQTQRQAARPQALENGYPHTTAVHRRAPDVDHPPAPRPAKLAQERPVGFAPRVEAHPGHVCPVHPHSFVVFLRLLFV